jgi:hypothetical protein
MTATRTAMATKILRRVPFHRKAFNLGCRENPGFSSGVYGFVQGSPNLL